MTLKRQAAKLALLLLMSAWCRRFPRFVASIAVCAALLLLPSCLASDAAPGDAAPRRSVTPIVADGAAMPGTGLSAIGASESVGAGLNAGSPLVAESNVGPQSQSTPEGAVSDARDQGCPPRLPDGFRVSDMSPAAASLEFSRTAFACARELGLAFASNPAAVSALASRGVEGPLLLLADTGFDATMVQEIERLEPERIVAAGITERHLRYALPGFAIERLPVTYSTDPTPVGTAFFAQGGPYHQVWIIGDDGSSEPLTAVARQVGVGVVAATGDLRALPSSARDAISGAAVVEVLADLGEDAAWQLEVVRRGGELPGGGLLLFGVDAANPVRRLLAAYGHPSTSALGVLGEQGPQETVERLQAIAEDYEADGLAVLPAFEIIATVASAGAGADGDYSNETAKDAIRPWVEAAAANGTYVVLDLQPGRSDFLSQAKIYEEFLALPHVGLALDPEWRLKPHQVHLAQIGTVDAAEINRVSEWLAGLVRRHSLPQKLLVIHQFHHSMIADREQINTPSELAVVIHMDGQGSQSAKYSTWNALTGQDDADRYFWGWKNFYDEDTPVATPTQVLELSPLPVFVSFQ